MATIDFPDTLIELERAAWQDIHGRLAGVTAFAEQAGLDRYEVEMALKRAVRHPEG